MLYEVITLLPDALLRLGIRRQCTDRLRAESAGGPEVQAERFHTRIEALRASPLRITSYNVCYTKLLRCCPMASMMAAFVAVIGISWLLVQERRPRLWYA